MIELSTTSWCVAIVCAALIGFSKTGIPGGGIIITPLMVTVLPAKTAVGFVLPMLILGDIIAIIYWRRHAVWKQLIRLIPWTFVGIILGYLLIERITNQQLMPVIGGIILGMITLGWWQNRLRMESVPRQWYFAGFIGILAGTTSMLAHAAGPIMMIYLLAMRFDKKQFIGTNAWFFWMLNLSKMPFTGKLDLIDKASLLTNISLLPAIIAGAVLGIFLVHRLPQKAFDLTIKIIAITIAIYLCLSPLLR